MTALIESATGQVESEIGNRQLVEATWLFGVPVLPSSTTLSALVDVVATPLPLTLPIFEATDLVNVSYIDKAGAPVDITPDLELVAGAWPSQVLPKMGMQWPTVHDDYTPRLNVATVEFKAASDEATLAMAKVAISQLVAAWFAVRAKETDRTISTVPSAMALIERLKVGVEFETYVG